MEWNQPPHGAKASPDLATNVSTQLLLDWSRNYGIVAVAALPGVSNERVTNNVVANISIFSVFNSTQHPVSQKVLVVGASASLLFDPTLHTSQGIHIEPKSIQSTRYTTLSAF